MQNILPGCFLKRISGQAFLGHPVPRLHAGIVPVAAIGKVVFVFRNGKQHVRPYVIPRNPRTPAQQAHRSVFSEAIRAWKELSVEEKEGLNKEACRMKRSGYNLFIGRYMRTAAQRLVPIIVRHKTARIMVRPVHKSCRTIRQTHRPMERHAYRTGIANRASPEYIAA